MTGTRVPAVATGVASPAGRADGLAIARAASSEADDVLRHLATDAVHGLPAGEVARRTALVGPNSVASHRARWTAVLWHQLRSPLLGLLVASAVASAFVGERSDAVIICVIVAVSVGLGFVNEYRAERSAEALHDRVRHQVVVLRDGAAVRVDVTALVPGDIVELRLGDIVPADVRLLAVTGLECDESVLTGEAVAVGKRVEPVAADAPLAELACAALMGTIVHAGSATGIVVATGVSTEFGRVAAGLSTHHLDTEFQLGLRRFSMLLVYVGLSLTAAIFVINVVLARPVLDALLFSLAIAVGITPQLLPAVVSTSLAAGARGMTRRQVLVKRLVSIEDLGNVDVLFTDKTGTLTVGRTEFMRAVAAPGAHRDDVLRWGLLCTETDPTVDSGIGGNALDRALWESPASHARRAELGAYTRLGVLPFDHDRMLVSVTVREPDVAPTLVTKGAPEIVLSRCTQVAPETRAALDAEFRAGNRVVAVATRAATHPGPPVAADERDLTLQGFLVLLDPPKPDAAAALERLRGLGITVKVVTGDSPTVAATVCRELGLGDASALTGQDLDRLDDTELAAAIARTTVFARVSPEDKARIVRVQRHAGGGVAFLGDGVNDALALHTADVGISVESATDVAKDAADVILLRKDLDVLADGVVEGRRIFANTIKYVLMGTSSNFGNMFSAAAASLFLRFLPMLPAQILLNNLLYDASQLAIPTDRVDEEQLRLPSHWDIGFIRRFMLVFGPLSSVFDLITFVLLLEVLHAGAPEFRSGWFVESLATQTLVIFVIRTRRVPFTRSHPSVAITATALTTVVVGAVLPATPLAHTLGFRALPGRYYAALAGMVVAYLVCIEVAKRWFYRAAVPAVVPAPRAYDHRRHLARRAARFSHRGGGGVTHRAARPPRRRRRRA